MIGFLIVTEHGCGERGEVLFPAAVLQRRGARFLALRLVTVFAQSLAVQLNAVRIMHDTVEDAIGERGIANLLMLAFHGQLRSENQRARLIAVFANFPEVTAFRFNERRHE